MKDNQLSSFSSALVTFEKYLIFFKGIQMNYIVIIHPLAFLIQLQIMKEKNVYKNHIVYRNQSDTKYITLRHLIFIFVKDHQIFKCLFTEFDLKISFQAII